MLVLSKSLTLDFICEFELSWYPFDYQQCRVEIQNFGSNDQIIQLTSNQIEMIGSKTVYQYEVKEPIFDYSKNNSIIIVIKLYRQLHYIILTNLLPTILINVVCKIHLKLYLYKFILITDLIRFALLQIFLLKTILKPLFQ